MYILILHNMCDMPQWSCWHWWQVSLNACSYLPGKWSELRRLWGQLRGIWWTWRLLSHMWWRWWLDLLRHMSSGIPHSLSPATTQEYTTVTVLYHTTSLTLCQPSDLQVNSHPNKVQGEGTPPLGFCWVTIPSPRERDFIEEEGCLISKSKFICHACFLNTASFIP